MANEVQIFEGLAVGPQDVLVLRSKESLTQETAQSARAVFERMGLRGRVVVIDGTMFEVVKVENGMANYEGNQKVIDYELEHTSGEKSGVMRGWCSVVPGRTCNVPAHWAPDGGRV